MISLPLIELNFVGERPSIDCCQNAKGPKTFANILLAGPCNLKCKFCFGNDNSVTARSWNVLKTPVDKLKNIDHFLKNISNQKIRSVVISGTNTEPLLYCDLEKLINKIWGYGLEPAVITNGFLVLDKILIINTLSKITYSLHTLNPITSKILLGTSKIPDWQKIFFDTKISFKVNVVVCEENKNEIQDILKFCDQLKVKRISLRDSLGYATVKDYLGQPVGSFAGCSIYKINNMEIMAWNAQALETNSWNWLPSGNVYEQKRLYKVLNGMDMEKPDMIFS